MHSKVLGAAIANGASLSGELSLGGGRLSAIQMPATWTAAALTFQISFDGATFVNAYDDSGTEISVTVAAGHGILLEPSKWVGVQYLKVRSGTAGLPVNQGGDRVIELILVE